MSVIDDEHKIDEHNLLILYATETGYALDIAEQVARELQRRGFANRLLSADSYPAENLINEDVVIFVVSTTGTGQEPHAMSQLWHMLLRADLPPDILEDLNFAVFGLGDSSYDKFCWAAKKLSRRLLSLGAHELVERGEGDEQHSLGIEGALDAWLPRLFDSFKVLFPSVHSPPSTSDILPPPRVNIASTSKSQSDDQSTNDTATQPENTFTATVKCNRRITAPDWNQDVRHIEFNLDENVTYYPGDVAVIHPKIPDNLVQAFIDMMDWADEADEMLRIESNETGLPISANVPQRTSLRRLFTEYLNFQAVPRRSFFDIIRHFAQEEREAERLAEFCGPQGAEEIYNYVTRARRTIYEVLAEFRSVKIPRDYLFDVFPTLLPRQFSIASSNIVYPKQIHLCVAVVRYKTRLKLPRLGICSNYLAALKPGDKLQLGLQKGYLTLPPDKLTPVLCIGPGTGIAPMRALLDHRIHEGSKENYLYFGCRSASKDCHYGDEWKAHAEAQNLNYRIAFSRDGPEGTKRTYVQDLMTEDAEQIWDIVGRRDGWVYISGSSNKMPKAVKEAIEAAACSAGALSKEDANLFMKRLYDEGRLFEECWS